MQQEDPLLPNEEYESYDVKSLFTKYVPFQETIDYILHEICVKNKLPKICSKLIFKRLLLKLSTKNTFIFTSNFYKQTDGCTIGGLLSVIFPYLCYMTRTEREVVNPSKPKFYKRFVDDVINRINKNQPDDLFQKLNSNHPNMKYTFEVKPEIFLDTKIVYSNDVITTEVKRNDRKLPVHWSSKVPKWYKRNAIISDLNRATRIASSPADEIPKIKQKFLNADYPYRFINSVINNFQKKSDGTDDYIIPPGFFDIPKKVVLVDIPYCPKNEEFSKRFMKKVDAFTDNKYDIHIKWITKKVKQLFKLKSRNPHPSCVIYEGVCSCQESYIGETVRNVEIRWQEHEDTQKDSEPAKHLKNNPTHSFTWKVFLSVSSIRRIRQNMKVSIIALKRPALNERVVSKKLLLFRNGVI